MFVYNARREDWIQENDVCVFKNFRIDRPHVYVFVSDKKISTLESVFKNFRIRPENTLDTCGRKPYLRFHKYPDTCGQGLIFHSNLRVFFTFEKER